MKPIVATTNDTSLAICRLVLGIVFFIHGAQLALGWFGGYGFSGTMHFMTTQLGIPVIFAAFAILAQFLGGIGLIVVLLAVSPPLASPASCSSPSSRFTSSWVSS